MVFIDFKMVNVEFPVFNAKTRSLTSQILERVTGGKLDSGANGTVVVKALSDVSFQASSGERIGLLGHNGAGKSTLLRTLSGIYYPKTGSAVVSGQVGSLIDINLGINPEATGRENIFIRGALLGIPKRELTSQLDSIIEFSELGDFIDLPVRTYSSGMQMRLGFSISTILKPEILLMDEWLSVGDEKFRNKAETRLLEVVDKTQILVLASHSRDLLEKVCNRLLWLEHGTIKMDGTVSKVSPAYFD